MLLLVFPNDILNFVSDKRTVFLAGTLGIVAGDFMPK